MLVMAGLIGGGIWGAFLAKKHGGNRLDIAQYSAVLALIFGVLGLALTVGIHRSSM